MVWPTPGFPQIGSIHGAVNSPEASPALLSAAVITPKIKLHTDLQATSRPSRYFPPRPPDCSEGGRSEDPQSPPGS